MRRLIDLDVGEIVEIGTSTVELKYKSGRKARLFISTQDTPIVHVKPGEHKSAGRSIFPEYDRSEQQLAIAAKIG